MLWLGRKWNDIQKELIEMNVDFICKVSYPDKKIVPYGDLRVARTSRKEGKLVFVLLHDRFKKY